MLNRTMPLATSTSHHGQIWEQRAGWLATASAAIQFGRMDLARPFVGCREIAISKNEAAARDMLAELVIGTMSNPELLKSQSRSVSSSRDLAQGT